MASDWGKIKEACPVCGGTVEWFEYGADCRGNPGSSGARCETNACEWTEEQRSAFWSDLFAKKQSDWEKACARDREQ